MKSVLVAFPILAAAAVVDFASLADQTLRVSTAVHLRSDGSEKYPFGERNRCFMPVLTGSAQALPTICSISA